jgi:hypothetical protein
VTADAFGFASDSEGVSDSEASNKDDGEDSIDEDEAAERQMKLIKQI